MSAAQIEATELSLGYTQYLERICGVVTPGHAQIVRRVLTAFYQYLTRRHIALEALAIEHVDVFLATYNSSYGHESQKKHRSIIRKFLRHLDLHCRVLKRDLASLVVGRVHFTQSRPPKFLRQNEIKKLFTSFEPSSSPHALRQYAMLHLAYTLGLRPCEISQIRLDDISFQQAEITLRTRKAFNPVRLPLSEETLKAIAAYIVGARAKTQHRELFLKLIEPRPVSASIVSSDITRCMRRAQVPGSAYWLRHTYAQQLLEQGQTLFAIKELLGHDDIQSTEHYLHIHTTLMRREILHESL
jgi:integrase/recombinase XerD